MLTYTIIEGSCEDLSYIKDDSISLVITSPPYFIAKEYSKTEVCIGMEKSFYAYLERMLKVFKQWYKVLKVGHYCVCNISDILVESYKYPIFAYYVLLLQKAGLQYDGDIIWRKPSGLKTSMAAKRFGVMMQNPYPRYYYPNNIYEHCLVFRKGRKPAYAERRDRNKVDCMKVIENKYDSDVWEINPVSAVLAQHAAPFPEELVRRFIKLYTVPGELVLEPFLGSGTSMKVAKDMKRSCIGYEVNSDYIPLIKKNVSWNQRTLSQTEQIKYLHLRGKQTPEQIKDIVTFNKIPDIIKEVVNNAKVKSEGDKEEGSINKSNNEHKETKEFSGVFLK